MILDMFRHKVGVVVMDIEEASVVDMVVIKRRKRKEKITISNWD